MANGNIKLRKPLNDKYLNITVTISREYMLRLWIACRLLKMVGFFLGVNKCNINLNAESEYDEGWISHNQMRKNNIHIYDCRGEKVPKVRAFKELDNSILVKCLVTNDEGKHITDSDDVVEFEAEIWGAKVCNG